jgi:GDPmannose 4,6-dehydratase
VFLAGSGLQFVNNGRGISEKDAFEASNPYSVARIQSVYAARYYRSLGLKVYVGYLFHHESPYRKPSHVSQLIALAVKRIASGSREIIELGNILVEKEWTFAGDVVEGIFTLVSQDKIFETVIGSGLGYTIQDWLSHCFSCIKKNWIDYVKIKEGYLSEYSCLVSDPSTIKSLGWEPKVNLSQLANLMVL